LVAPLYFLLTTFATVGYGDIVPITDIDKIFCVSFLLQLILFVFVTVNIINDQSQAALDKFNKPSKEILNYLQRETSVLIHEVETGLFDKKLDEKIKLFRLHSGGIGLFLNEYKKNRSRSDDFSI
jgi:hypothetical protein